MNQNSGNDESKSLWHGRFLEQSADELQKLNNSISYDIRLFSQDIEGSRVHAKMLQKIGVRRSLAGTSPKPLRSRRSRAKGSPKPRQSLLEPRRHLPVRRNIPEASPKPHRDVAEIRNFAEISPKTFFYHQ